MAATVTVTSSITPKTISRKIPLFFPRNTPIITSILSPQNPHSYTPRYFTPISSTPRHFPTFLTSHSSLIPTNTTLSQLGFSGFSCRRMDKGYTAIPASSGGDNGGDVGGFGGGGSGGDGDGGGDESGGSSERGLLSWYMDLLVKFPVMTKAVTCALLNMVGDLICQVVIDKSQTLDYKRTFMFTFLGLVLVGPTLHFWYLYLSKLVTMPGASGAFLRLFLDQGFFAPIFIGVFLSALVTLEGRPSEVVPKLQQEWFSSVIANWQLWIPFQFLNFRFVPQQFQVLASNFVALVWNVILSFKAHKEIAPK